MKQSVKFIQLRDILIIYVLTNFCKMKIVVFVVTVYVWLVSFKCTSLYVNWRTLDQPHHMLLIFNKVFAP